MQRFFIFFFINMLALPLGAVEVGDVVFKTSFDEPNVLDRWTGSRTPSVALVDKTIRISLSADGNEKHASVTQKLPIEQLRGTRLRVAGRIKADNVKEPPQSYNGVKMMLILDTPGGKQWLQRDGIWGTFDWKEVVFTAEVPEDITEATLLLGIENTTGIAWFDDITITVIGKKPQKPQRAGSEGGTPPELPGPLYKGHDLSRLRGAMIKPDSFRSEDLDVLAGKWKANHIRWQLLWDGFPNGPADTATVVEFDAWIDKQCAQLDKLLPELECYGVRVCLDLHTPPGGRLPQAQGSAMRMFQEKQFQDAFVETWQKLARKYKDSKVIWCYELLNEAVEGNIPANAGLLDWRELALKTSKEIRKIDSVKAIVIEPAPWGDPKALEWFEPFDSKEVPNVVYSVHMYLPHKFTHQNVYGTEPELVYPGTMPDGTQWDKEQIRRALKVVKEYSEDYGVAIYIGEFGSIRWAPENSSYRYLKDCIEVFEEEGWDWAYHAFREWDGWSVEHGSDKNDRRPVADPTDRELLLRSWFEKNER
jgi:hypothetical protein